MEYRTQTTRATLTMTVTIPAILDDGESALGAMPCAIVGGSRALALIYVKQGGGLSRLSSSRRNTDPLGKGH